MSTKYHPGKSYLATHTHEKKKRPFRSYKYRRKRTRTNLCWWTFWLSQNYPRQPISVLIYIERHWCWLQPWPYATHKWLHFRYAPIQLQQTKTMTYFSFHLLHSHHNNNVPYMRKIIFILQERLITVYPFATQKDPLEMR